MKYSIKEYLLILSLITLSGCATIFNDKNKTIHLVSSDNKAVEVKIIKDGKVENTSLPATIKTSLNHNTNVNIQTTDSCYHRTNYEIKKTVSPYYWLNIFNIHGLYIDYLNDRIWDYPGNIIIPAYELENTDNTCKNPLTASEKLVFVNKKSSIKRENNKQELKSKDKSINRYSYEFGFLISPFNYHEEIYSKGVYAGLKYKTNSNWFATINVANQKMGCSNLIDKLYMNLCENEREIFTSQKNIIFSINYKLDNSYGAYIGAGTGITSVKQSYIGNDQQSIDSSAIVMPLTVNFGFQTPHDFKIKLISSTSLESLGLANSNVFVNKNNTHKIINIKSRQKAISVFDSAKNYSIVGMGIEWPAKGMLSHIGSIMLSTYIYVL